MSVALSKYDAACRAVAAAKTVDEAKDIRDKSIAMQAYARQARNKDLEADALEIRMRATRRIDELRRAQKESVGLNRYASRHCFLALLADGWTFANGIAEEMLGHHGNYSVLLQRGQW